jgi:tetratricopeptide (TPR) repeat protein
MQAAPNDAVVRVELAQLLARTERATQGIALLEETVTRLPDDARAREGLIRAYIDTGDLQSARAAAEELKARQPQSVAGFYYAGLIAARQKRESRNDFESALKLQPRRLDVLAALTRIEVARGSYDAAIGRVETALEQDPKNADLLDLLGGLYLDRKDLKHAGDMFSRASAANPRLWQPHRNLALVKLAASDPGGASSEYQAAVKLAPAEPQLVAAAAAFYEKGCVAGVGARIGTSTRFEGDPLSPRNGPTAVGTAGSGAEQSRIGADRVR